MCMKYEYVFGIGKRGVGLVEREEHFFFYEPTEMVEFRRLYDITLKESNEYVVGVDMIPQENPYHVVNRLCESLKETFRYEAVTFIHLGKEDDEFFGESAKHTIATICLRDVEKEDCPKVDVTGMDGAQMIDAIMSKVKEVL